MPARWIAVSPGGAPLAVLAALALATASGLLIPVQTGAQTPAAKIEAPPGLATTLLDGKVFVGEVGVAGRPAHLTDEWNFERGLLWSRECLKCGYAPSAYEIWREGEALHFATAGICEVDSARIVWRGTYRNGGIEGTMHWTRKRWYRTIEKTFWFHATLVEGRTPRLDSEEVDEVAGRAGLE